MESVCRRAAAKSNGNPAEGFSAAAAQLVAGRPDGLNFWHIS
jgi:hypothetical protein